MFLPNFYHRVSHFFPKKFWPRLLPISLPNSGTYFSTITTGVVLPWTPTNLPDSILPPGRPRYKKLCKKDNHELEAIKKPLKKKIANFVVK